MEDEEKQTLESDKSSLSPDTDVENHGGTPDDAHSEIEKLDSGHQMDLAMKKQEVRQFKP